MEFLDLCYEMCIPTLLLAMRVDVYVYVPVV